MLFKYLRSLHDGYRTFPSRPTSRLPLRHLTSLIALSDLRPGLHAHPGPHNGPGCDLDSIHCSSKAWPSPFVAALLQIPAPLSNTLPKPYGVTIFSLPPWSAWRRHGIVRKTGGETISFTPKRNTTSLISNFRILFLPLAYPSSL